MTAQPWTTAPLVALDLEGTGGQDRDREQILEIAIVPLDNGFPNLAAAWDSTVNPGRAVAPRPWISRDLTGNRLATAPTLDDIQAEILDRLDRRIIVGHNIGVDWRLLHRHPPQVQPAALIDTARLYRHFNPACQRWNLVRLLEKYALNAQVAQLVPTGRPHRALWDAVGAALLLPALVEDLPATTTPTAQELVEMAGIRIQDKPPHLAKAEQIALDV
ncbi:3'-5' exonuclease [Nonomuraea sp. NN258]|uniref:3'-5' exonuclease n=1 Tax=Nonomuraea antri TaxID=2730852 RepID=UPI0015699995|nr:3'-5' exonuclease [Nonomuraea antri]NRQ34544.1 3'-5' exonuclease [Nonomuraea antri]